MSVTPTTSSTKPRTLSVILERPNVGHGSGAVLEKLISAEDRKNIHFFYFERNRFDYSAFPSTHINYLAFFTAALMKQRRRFSLRHWRRWIFGSRLYSWYYRRRLKREVSAYEPCAIVGVIADLGTARLLVWLAELFPNARLKLVVWDLLDDGREGAVFEELAKLKGRFDCASVVSEPLRKNLASRAGIDAEVSFPFIIKKRVETLDYSHRSGISMVGHVRTPGVYDCISEIGGRLEGLFGEKPVSWFGGQSVKQSGQAPDGVWQFLRAEAFLPDEEYYERLSRARWGLIPFDDSLEPSSSYTRYSIPSRIADFVSVGTPLIFIGGEGSATGKLIEEYGLGVVLIRKDSSMIEQLDTCIDSPSNWRVFHENCMQFSERYDVSQVRDKFSKIFLS